MKKLTLKSCLVSFFLLVTLFSYSQNVKFNYDAAGNRTSRITVDKEIKSELADTILPGNSGKQLNQNTENLEILVFPNPTSAIINIQSFNLNKSSGLNMYLFSAKGELLKILELINTTQTIDLTGYANGIYYLKIQMSDKTESWKIVKL